MIYFNPRARKERDCLAQCQALLQKYFNPRARKERDSFVSFIIFIFLNFNPRARKERDVFIVMQMVSQKKFQSTRP